MTPPLIPTSKMSGKINYLSKTLWIFLACIYVTVTQPHINFYQKFKMQLKCKICKYRFTETVSELNIKIWQFTSSYLVTCNEFIPFDVVKQSSFLQSSFFFLFNWLLRRHWLLIFYKRSWVSVIKNWVTIE